jgi:hypothetical protein
MVVENLIPHLHGTQKIAGLIVSHPIPDRLFLLTKEREGIFGGFLFDQPVVHRRLFLVQIEKK